jgi:hypothetical protein
MENLCTCSSCGNEITENDFVAINLAGESLCESCESSAWEYTNKVLVAHEGELTSYEWCSDFGFRDLEYYEQSDPDGVDGFTYHRIDGWRGYWEPEISKGFIDVASGWSTGRYDDVSWKHKFNDLMSDIQQGELSCPCKIVFVFGLTSNVFSASTDVLIKETELEKFTNWLQDEAGLTIEDLKQSLT